MKLSVIILNYNVSSFLELCLRSVESALQNLDAEIIVIDNKSLDDSCEMVKDKFPQAILIENKENYGFPKGNNIGVDKAKGKYVCILNPDTVVSEDTFVKVLHFAENTSDLGAIGVRLVDGKGVFLSESKRGIPTPWVAFTKVSGLYKLFPQSKNFDQYYASHLTENQTSTVDILVGAFMFLKKDIYQEVGGFDEGCFMYSDDIDLSYTLLQKGLKNYYFSDTTVIHYKGESTVKDRLFMMRFREAMNFFYKKHLQVSLFFNLFMWIGVYFFAGVKWFKGKKIISKNVDEYVLISENTLLQKQIQDTLHKKTSLFFSVQQFEERQKNKDSKHVEIIFDNQFITFKNIIETIVTCRLKSFTYKIRPKQSNLLIGSDSSDTRGEVVKLI